MSYAKVVTSSMMAKSKQLHKLPIVLYVPNLLGYARIVSAFLGLYCSCINQPVTAVIVWICSSLLDLIDGIVARVLHQTSKFGIVLDIFADNILRTSVWMATSNAAYHYYHSADYSNDASSSYNSALVVMVSCLIICIEWITMVSTQVFAATNHGTHWKEARDQDPYIIQVFFSNNFRNPLGCIGIYGLFASNLFLYGSFHPVLYDNIPYFHFFMYVAFIGRFISLTIEIRFCYSYLSFVLSDERTIT
jgi:phosphatidylglycerophosphate synthase